MCNVHAVREKFQETKKAHLHPFQVKPLPLKWGGKRNIYWARNLFISNFKGLNHLLRYVLHLLGPSMNL